MSPAPTGQQFEFLACLGAGGFGEVYLAKMTLESGLERRVAVKLLHGEVDDGAVRRLRDEGRLLAALNHRAILQVHDLVMIDSRTALVMEFVDGEDLAELVRAPGSLPVRCAIEVVGEVAGALNGALTTRAPGSDEAMGLVHRDIKPGNIRIARTGGVKLLDFGIAVSRTVQREAKTGTGLVIGTLGFLAPERITEADVKPPSDIYALGCVLFEALAGEPLHLGLNQQQLLRHAVLPALHDGFVDGRIGALPEAVSEPVRALVRKLVSFEPSERPTAAALEQECDDLAGALDGPHLRRWARDRSWPEPAWGSGGLTGQRREGRQSVSQSGVGRDTFTLDVERPEPAADVEVALPASTLVEPSAGANAPPAGPGRGVVITAVFAGVGALGLGFAAQWVFTESPELTAATAAPAAEPTVQLEDPTPPAAEPTPLPSPAAASDAAPKRSPKRKEDPAATPPPPEPEAAATEVMVEIKSYPLGARVKLFGKELCVTPCKASLPLGTHLAEFSLPDGRKADEVLSVTPESRSFGHKFP